MSDEAQLPSLGSLKDFSLFQNPLTHGLFLLPCCPRDKKHSSVQTHFHRFKYILNTFLQRPTLAVIQKCRLNIGSNKYLPNSQLTYAKYCKNAPIDFDSIYSEGNLHSLVHSRTIQHMWVNKTYKISEIWIEFHNRIMNV